MTFTPLLYIDKDSKTMHLSFKELSYIDVTICKLESAITVFFAIPVMSLVFTAVNPPCLAITFDAALDKLP